MYFLLPPTKSWNSPWSILAFSKVLYSIKIKPDSCKNGNEPTGQPRIYWSLPNILKNLGLHSTWISWDATELLQTGWENSPLGCPGPSPCPYIFSQELQLPSPVPWFLEISFTFFYNAHFFFKAKYSAKVTLLCTAAVKEHSSVPPLTIYLSSISQMPTTSFSFGSRPKATRNIVIAGTNFYKEVPSMQDRNHTRDYTFYKTKEQFLQEKV